MTLLKEIACSPSLFVGVNRVMEDDEGLLGASIIKSRRSCPILIADRKVAFAFFLAICAQKWCEKTDALEKQRRASFCC